MDHGSELGDLGWAVGSSSDVTGTATSSVGKSTGTAKSAGVRRGLDVCVIGGALGMVGIWSLML